MKDEGIAMPNIQNALEQLVVGNIESALNICDFLEEFCPEVNDTEFVRGLSTDLRGRRYGKIGLYPAAETEYEAAIDHFTRFLIKHPNNSHFSTLAANRRGQLRLALNDLPGAIMDFSTVIEREPKNALAYFHRGRAYFEQYDFPSAVSDLDISIRLDEKRRSEPYELKGVMALLYRKYPSARNYFKQARQYCDSRPEKMRYMLFEAAGEYLNDNYSAAEVLLRNVEGMADLLRGWEWHEIQQKIKILKDHLAPKIEAPEITAVRDMERQQLKTTCDAILKRIFEFFQNPFQAPAVAIV